MPAGRPTHPKIHDLPAVAPAQVWQAGLPAVALAQAWQAGFESCASTSSKLRSWVGSFFNEALEEFLSDSTFQILFANSGLWSGRKCFDPNQFKRQIWPGRSIGSAVVLEDPLVQIVSQSDIDVRTRQTSDCIYEVHA